VVAVHQVHPAVRRARRDTEKVRNRDTLKEENRSRDSRAKKSDPTVHPAPSAANPRAKRAREPGVRRYLRGSARESAEPLPLRPRGIKTLETKRTRAQRRQRLGEVSFAVNVYSRRYICSYRCKLAENAHNEAAHTLLQQAELARQTLGEIDLAPIDIGPAICHRGAHGSARRRIR